MKHNNRHITKGVFLLLLTVAVFLTSVGIHYTASSLDREEISSKTTSDNSPKEERVSASPNFEAVVVSLIHPDFAKEILFYSFEFAPFTETILLPSQRSIISDKYFRTLFTYFISPNAP